MPTEHGHGVSSDNTPFDRLTTLCSEMTKVLDDDDNKDVRAVIMIDDGERGGIQIHGYDGDNATGEAVTDLILHLRSILRLMGKDLVVGFAEVE